MRRLNLLISLTALLLITSCAEHRPAPVRDANFNNKNNSSQPLSKQNKYKPKSTVVKKGDTLYSIGFKHQIDFKKIAALNNIQKPYRIYPGQRLKLKGQIKKSNPKVKTNKIVSSPKITPKIAKQTPSKVTKTKKPNTKPKLQTSTVQKPVVKKPNASKPKINNNPKVVANPRPKPLQKPVQAPSSNQRWIWPAQGRLLKTFSSKDVSRKGINISTKIYSPIYATNNGVVVYSGNGLLGYGELIIIKHSDTLLSAYAHNSKRLVAEGDIVKQGDTIAKSGKDSEGTPLLHFEIRKNGQPVNPMNYLPKK